MELDLLPTSHSIDYGPANPALEVLSVQFLAEHEGDVLAGQDTPKDWNGLQTNICTDLPT